MRSKFIANKSRGYTLLELSLALLISIIVVAGGLLLFGSANHLRKVNESVQQIEEAVRVTHALNQGSSIYWVTTNTLMNSKEFPPKWVRGASAGTPTSISNPFGGDLTVVAGTNIGSATDYTFAVAITALDQRACISMLTSNIGPFVLSRGIDANPRIQGQVPPTPAQANTFCSGSGTHTISWEFF